MADAALEQTIDKILSQTEGEVLSGIDSALAESRATLDGAAAMLEQEYDRILADGRKEADKLEKQIVGGSDLEARNRQLMALEEAVDRVFAQALKQVADADRGGGYGALVKSLLDEATGALGTTEVVVYTSAGDAGAVKAALPGYAGAELASEPIECLGGVRIRSKDGAMTFDNTLDARIERLKPLIRKEIAGRFGVGS